MLDQFQPSVIGKSHWQIKTTFDIFHLRILECLQFIPATTVGQNNLDVVDTMENHEVVKIECFLK